MHLQPYDCVDGTLFSITREDLLRQRGQPRSQARNEVGLTALDYGDVVFRFQDCGRLEEVTVWAEVLHLDEVAVPFGALAGFVRGHDALLFGRAGFLVSPAFGIAFVPAEPCWVTALARHAVAQWERIRVS